MKVPISEAARILGISIGTLRRWDREGKFEAERTPAGHQHYDLNKLKRIVSNRFPDPELGRITLGYARVSSNDQKEDLRRQATLVSEFCTVNGWEHEIIRDLGSGLNYRKRGLRRLIKCICSGEVKRLVLTHKDRLLRFGSELIFALCEEFGAEVVIINQTEQDIYAVQRLWAHQGFYAEPTSATVIAALDRVNALAGPDESIVIPLTGSGLKGSPALE